MSETQDWYPAPYIKRLVDAGITLPADRAEVLMLVLNDVRADAVKAEQKRVETLEAALRRIAGRTQYGDAVLREVGLPTASDIASAALAATETR